MIQLINTGSTRQGCCMTQFRCSPYNRGAQIIGVRLTRRLILYGTVQPNICRSSVWNLLHVTFWHLKLLKCPLNLGGGGICGFSPHKYHSHHQRKYLYHCISLQLKVIQGLSFSGNCHVTINGTRSNITGKCTLYKCINLYPYPCVLKLFHSGYTLVDITLRTGDADLRLGI